MLEESACPKCLDKRPAVPGKNQEQLSKAVSDSIPYGQQPKLSLKEAFHERPAKAAQGIWDQQPVESGPLKGMWPGDQKESGPVTRGDKITPDATKEAVLI
ncbi:hypothetical protein DPX16_16588 [Anabarilius grahami]|uniref:Uncharacterized protein n=1 Tax=Anabarilius grahami TaxID=495550 RepID=A0A3N0XV42_ANAGA|nr:hypothetical protein DPX16_16588 [Anabarilius grahami]